MKKSYGILFIKMNNINIGDEKCLNQKHYIVKKKLKIIL